MGVIAMNRAGIVTVSVDIQTEVLVDIWTGHPAVVLDVIDLAAVKVRGDLVAVNDDPVETVASVVAPAANLTMGVRVLIVV